MEKKHYTSLAEFDGLEKLARTNYLTLPSSVGKFIQVQKSGMYGLLDMELNEVLPCEFDKKMLISYGLIQVRKDKLCGVFSHKGHPVLPVEFREVDIQRSYIRARRARLWEIFTRDGATLIPGKFKYIGIQSDKYICAQRKKHEGMYAMDGTPILPFEFDGIYVVDGTCFVIRKNGFYGAYSLDGTLICPIEFDYIAAKENDEEIEAFKHIPLSFTGIDGVVKFLELSSSHDDNISIVNGNEIRLRRLFDIHGNPINQSNSYLETLGPNGVHKYFRYDGSPIDT